MHVPFCASTCDFCAFYQIQPTRERLDRYFAGIEREMTLAPAARSPATVFWGGGTPGLLSPADIRLLGGLVRAWGSAPGAQDLGQGAPEVGLGAWGTGLGVEEWTVEMAPAFVTEARLEALREIGVTRISLGVQSFDEARLEALGRQHTAAQARRGYDLIRSAGFDNVNVDLMFALPGQSLANWQEDLDQAIALAPDHISTYCLTLEEDTRLWLRLAHLHQANGVQPASNPDSRPSALDPELEAELYRLSWERLENAGFAQYEVSNFARPGKACLHNLNTWRMAEWVGLGPSAASQSGGWRGANVADLDRWRADLESGQRAVVDRVAVTPRLRAEDALIFGLRMNEGVDVGEWREVEPAAPWPEVEGAISRLVEAGIAVRSEGRVSLTLKGRLVADAVGSELMEAFSTAGVAMT